MPRGKPMWQEWFHVIQIGPHWLRFGWAFGAAPGSHRGLWRTRAYGLHGINLRIGPLRRCWTGLVHYQRKETVGRCKRCGYHGCGHSDAAL